MVAVVGGGTKLMSAGLPSRPPKIEPNNPAEPACIVRVEGASNLFAQLVARSTLAPDVRPSSDWLLELLPSNWRKYDE
jgi:hypothetical protein